MTRLALLLLAALPCSSQELAEVVPPEERVTARVIFLVDTSGSMKPARLPTASSRLRRASGSSPVTP